MVAEPTVVPPIDPSVQSQGERPTDPPHPTLPREGGGALSGTFSIGPSPLAGEGWVRGIKSARGSRTPPCCSCLPSADDLLVDHPGAVLPVLQGFLRDGELVVAAGLDGHAGEQERVVLVVHVADDLHDVVAGDAVLACLLQD